MSYPSPALPLSLTEFQDGPSATVRLRPGGCKDASHDPVSWPARIPEGLPRDPGARGRVRSPCVSELLRFGGRYSTFAFCLCFGNPQTRVRRNLSHSKDYRRQMQWDSERSLPACALAPLFQSALVIAVFAPSSEPERKHSQERPIPREPVWKARLAAPLLRG